MWLAKWTFIRIGHPVSKLSRVTETSYLCIKLLDRGEKFRWFEEKKFISLNLEEKQEALYDQDIEIRIKAHNWNLPMLTC